MKHGNQQNRAVHYYFVSEVLNYAKTPRSGRK